MQDHGSKQVCPFASISAKLAGTEGAVSLRETPGPGGIIAFDKTVNPLVFLKDLLEKYGDVVRYQTRFGPCFVFVDPGHVKAILHDEAFRRTSLVKMMLGEGVLASDGVWWRGQRRLMQKEFLPAALGPMAGFIGPEVEKTCALWEAALRAGGEVDVTRSMTELTLRIIVRALCSEELSPAQCTALCGAITQTVTDLGAISWTVFGAPVSFKPHTQAQFASGRGLVDEVCRGMIARRRAMPEGERPADLLTLLVEAETAGGPLSDQQVRDEIVTMLIGGHETTALALAWGWKLLAEHPEVEERLTREIEEVLDGRAPAPGDVEKLRYTKAVFQEAMRLYPPVWYMARVASASRVVDGHAIPQGACVLVSAWFTHRHAAHWKEAERFWPERFLEEGNEAMARYAYFPFGGGRHQCMGMHFAWIEGVLILGGLAQKFRVRPLADVVVEPDLGITLRQSPSMRAMVEMRAGER